MLAASALSLAAKRWWKPVALALAVGASWWAFTSWRDNLVETAEARGFNRAEAQYAVAIDAANKMVERDNSSMQMMAGLIGGLATQRAQAIDLTVKPHIERIQNEVASDPRYRDCAVSERVLHDANAIRATVDAAIASSNPALDRSRP